MTNKAKRVLYIEDSRELLESVVDVLELGGYATFGAQDGKHGIDMALNEGPDLILLDISLPDMSGFDVLLRLRNSPQCRKVPVVALTGRMVGRDKELSEAKFSGYLQKPFSAAELIAVTHQFA